MTRRPHRPERIVVVGGGLAAASAVVGLREHGYAGAVTLVCAEPHLPYERPPLSKGYLAGDTPLDDVFVRPRDWYQEHDVDVLLGTTAREIDLAARTVTLDAVRVEYDRLLVATGASARRLPFLDASGAPVAYLRTLDDSTRLRRELRPGVRVVIVGGGWIGLEVAASARAAGCEVTVVEALETPLQQVLGPELGDVFATLHREHGVDLRTSRMVTHARLEGGDVLVGLDDGTVLSADLLVVGAGAVPDVALAERANLKVDDGIVVDALLRTSDPDVFAAGDVASAYHPVLGAHLRVEHWDNAIGQGRCAAVNMLGGAEPYERLPYFFTDQYDLGMEYVGHVGRSGYDEVVIRGDVRERVFTAFWIVEGRVVAGLHVNDWDAIDHVRSVVAAGAVDLTALRDVSVPLAEIGP
jgi:3-phenylpropionate/trans-cinnamate dioxygenase ferredoxin reductase component